MRLFDLIVHEKYSFSSCYQPLINYLKVNHLEAYGRRLWMELIIVCTHACQLEAESLLPRHYEHPQIEFHGLCF